MDAISVWVTPGLLLRLFKHTGNVGLSQESYDSMTRMKIAATAMFIRSIRTNFVEQCCSPVDCRPDGDGDAPDSE